MWWLIATACLIQTIGSSEEITRRKRDVNPEIHMNVSQVIVYRGYPSEEYEVLTDDDYYLTINRIPYGRSHLTVRGPKPVVFLQHGLFGEASHWVENMANNSLGFILADAGYDVWLGNNRGTSWSRKHQNLTADDEDYWNFSFHEMAMHDLPAMINFVLKKTRQKQLYYVGYSQGCTIGFIAFSAMPELSRKIKMFFALAPVITIKHARSPTLKLLSSLPDYSPKDILASRDFILSRKPMKDLTTKLCSNILMQKFCGNLIFFSGGFNATNLNMSRIDVYAARYPDGTSVKNILHWKQTRESGLFRYFDYGSDNQVKYNQSYPPSYKVEDMVLPTAVWSGGNDLIASREDTAVLLSRITNLVYQHELSDWNHWDFIWGLSAPKQIYCKILQLMKKDQ
ncbi:lysosomal acid lipase/cholesteryl ester hydrolase-like [Sceloporus undulatus]|uniref:lysosomal acid lipase/cholesteryl ester hydrolase-like n=1 Tax=Sceloporus undulatus TaxID=8520 RepID=UPI001C4C8B55|nr:lysosomal acid lipase/cholesteryl ester hydrolase-like [Sceloporus undulatus]XP_042315944.1 lysosomal acid lipase/cholesteryl ester hydrolase-like [Sceloporus undulatus]